MPTKKYTVKSRDSGSYHIEISWKGLFKNTTVTCNGQELARLADQKEVKAGKEFPLPDGSQLKVQLVQKFANAELQVLRDGEPLPGSGSHPGEHLKGAYGVIFFVAGLNVIVGLLAELLKVEILIRLGLGVGSIIFGVLFFFLGYFVKRRSMVALGISVFLFALDGILSVVFVAEQGGRPPVGGIVFRIFLLIPMIRGFAAIRALKKEDQY